MAIFNITNKSVDRFLDFTTDITFITVDNVNLRISEYQIHTENI